MSKLFNRDVKRQILKRTRGTRFSEFASTRGLQLEPLEPRVMLHADVVSEILASNGGGLRDRDGDSPDWGCGNFRWRNLGEIGRIVSFGFLVV